MTYTIRPCLLSDLPVLVDLCALHAAYEGATYDPIDKKEALEKALFGVNPRLHCLVVETGLGVVGYASYTIDFSTWTANRYLHLDCLYLREQTRGMGIGAVLMMQLKTIAQSQGCDRMEWQTPTSNESGIRFYERLGAMGKEKMRFVWETDDGNKVHST